jgi:CheY-like chemotaxis protein
MFFGPLCRIPATVVQSVCDEERIKCPAAGMDGFLSNPLDQAELANIIEGIRFKVSSTNAP